MNHFAADSYDSDQLKYRVCVDSLCPYNPEDKWCQTSCALSVYDDHNKYQLAHAYADGRPPNQPGCPDSVGVGSTRANNVFLDARGAYGRNGASATSGMYYAESASSSRCLCIALVAMALAVCAMYLLKSKK